MPKTDQLVQWWEERIEKLKNQIMKNIYNADKVRVFRK